MTISTKHHKEAAAKDSKKRKHKDKDGDKTTDVVSAGTEEAKLYSRRLLKAK